MSTLVVLLMASLALVSQAYPHHEGMLNHCHHHDFLDLAATIAVFVIRNDIDDGSAMTPPPLMSCIPEEHRKKIRHQCHDHSDHTPSMTATCFLDMMKAVDNATGVVNTAMLELLAIEPTSLTTEQKILASKSLKSCIESNFTLPPPPDFVLATRNITMEEFIAKYDHDSDAMRVVVCVARALIENGCSSTSPSAALAIASVNGDDTSSSEEDSSHSDDDQLIAGVQNPLA